MIQSKVIIIFVFCNKGSFVFHINFDLACISQKTQKLYGPEKPFVKLRAAYSVKLVFLYVVKGIKIKITAKFCDTEHFRFEKWAPGH